jgi:hypothetical protein
VNVSSSDSEICVQKADGLPNLEDAFANRNQRDQSQLSRVSASAGILDGGSPLLPHIEPEIGEPSLTITMSYFATGSKTGLPFSKASIPQTVRGSVSGLKLKSSTDKPVEKTTPCSLNNP